MALDVTLLTSGIAGAVVISVFSSDFPDVSGFLMPRTVDATAVTFTEPDELIPRTSISRQSASGSQQNSPTCNRPIIHVGAKVNRFLNKTTTFVDKLKQKPLVGKISELVKNAQEKIEHFQMRVFNALRINCLIPKMIRPFKPILEFFRCKFGLDADEFMEAAQCNEVRCEESLEDKIITHDRGPVLMNTMDLDVRTLSDCFGDMKEVKYGARVLAKIVRDKSCDDPEYQEICQELIDDNRVIMEENCKTTE